MDYLEKENLILKRLRETDYALFGGSKEDALAFVANNLLTISDYQNIAVRSNILKTTHGEYTDFFDEANRAREDAFEAAAKSVDELNELCHELGLKPFMSTNIINIIGFKATISDYTAELFSIQCTPA